MDIALFPPYIFTLLIFPPSYLPEIYLCVYNLINELCAISKLILCLQLCVGQPR